MGLFDVVVRAFGQVVHQTEWVMLTAFVRCCGFRGSCWPGSATWPRRPLRRLAGGRHGGCFGLFASSNVLDDGADLAVAVVVKGIATMSRHRTRDPSMRLCFHSKWMIWPDSICWRTWASLSARPGHLCEGGSWAADWGAADEILLARAPNMARAAGLQRVTARSESRTGKQNRACSNTACERASTCLRSVMSAQ